MRSSTPVWGATITAQGTQRQGDTVWPSVQVGYDDDDDNNNDMMIKNRTIFVDQLLSDWGSSIVNKAGQRVFFRAIFQDLFLIIFVRAF